MTTGRRSGAGVGADAAEDFQAVHFRHHHVEQYQVGKVDSKLLHGSLMPAGGGGEV